MKNLWRKSHLCWTKGGQYQTEWDQSPIILDSKPILFECELEHEWRAAGYVVHSCQVCERRDWDKAGNKYNATMVVRDTIDAVHDALNKKQITEVQFDWVKYIVYFKRSRPGYAGIKITKQEKWPKK